MRDWVDDETLTHEEWEQNFDETWARGIPVEIVGPWRPPDDGTSADQVE